MSVLIYLISICLTIVSGILLIPYAIRINWLMASLVFLLYFLVIIRLLSLIGKRKRGILNRIIRRNDD